MTSDQLVTCFDKLDWAGMVAVLRRVVLPRVRVGREIEEEDNGKIEGEVEPREAAFEVTDEEGEDGMVVEGGGLGRLEYLNDLGVIMLPDQEWAVAGDAPGMAKEGRVSS